MTQLTIANKDQSTKTYAQKLFHNFSGDFVGRVTPVPIPNTEVKPVGADGTARVTVWESRKSPGLLTKPARVIKLPRAFSLTHSSRQPITRVNSLGERRMSCGVK